VGIRGKESHLTFRVATISTVCVGFDKFADGQTVGCFFGGAAGVFAHGVSFGLDESSIARASKKCL
jgi:hypothetical protein